MVRMNRRTLSEVYERLFERYGSVAGPEVDDPFHLIGEPGAEKILLLTRTHPVLALDSNGLRVLLRLGYGEQGSGYRRTYDRVRQAVDGEARAEVDWLITLRELLRRHGQVTCRRNRPACPECPLAAICAYSAGGH